MKPNNTPPRNAQRIYRVGDLPKDRSPAQYRITRRDGETVTANLRKRRRQILDLLMQGPVYCASPVRISDIVCILKHECGLDVETVFYPGDKEAGAGDFGVYFLHSAVARLDGVGVAA
ncbi:hypothetical protein [Defluviimonas salinarum]|uniref:Uncharacterized protein n=1 Tax=Defluviimonas salinarum TaxID=2992147 RepID=A0ABT3JAB5_9RHOB|nr:hypothetical protein [Defluviimonas salinarum]MCW3784344.1 hypothetical protein [Defluviimonas salinarum]